jgi:TPR repeat protein
MFSNGWGVDQDFTEASKWFRLAAGHDYSEPSESWDTISSH